MKLKCILCLCSLILVSGCSPRKAPDPTPTPDCPWGPTCPPQGGVVIQPQTLSRLFNNFTSSNSPLSIFTKLESKSE